MISAHNEQNEDLQARMSAHVCIKMTTAQYKLKCKLRCSRRAGKHGEAKNGKKSI